MSIQSNFWHVANLSLICNGVVPHKHNDIYPFLQGCSWAALLDPGPLWQGLDLKLGPN